jgi:hypothetical protein
MTTNRTIRLSMLGVAAAALLFSVPASGQQAATDNVPTVSFAPETLLPSGAIVYGSGTMVVRMRDAVYATAHTSGLTPGTVATAWLAAFNDPRYCATRPCTPADFGNPAARGTLLGIGGQVVGDDGTADFAEFRHVGDVTNAWVAGPGVEDTRRAEIHVAIRAHGPASADQNVLAEQLRTFNGGCPPNACATVQLAVHTP